MWEGRWVHGRVSECVGGYVGVWEGKCLFGRAGGCVGG